MRQTRLILLGTVLGVGFLFSGQGSEAGDVTVFTARNLPSDQWASGYGAALSSTWFRFATFEAEVARTTGDAADSGMTSFTGSALLSVPLGFVTPYGGVGVGLFRQTSAADSDVGHLKAFILGIKIHIGGVLVIRGDYRKFDLSGPPLLALDQRLAAGVGITF
jgi:hypothetical protein